MNLHIHLLVCPMMASWICNDLTFLWGKKRKGDDRVIVRVNNNGSLNSSIRKLQILTYQGANFGGINGVGNKEKVRKHSNDELLLRSLCPLPLYDVELTNFTKAFFPFVNAEKFVSVTSSAPAAFAKVTKQAASKIEMSPFTMVLSF